MYTIHTLWAWRKGEDGPELLEAWDDYSVDNNFDGWQAAKEKALASLGNDISELGHRIIEIKVDGAKIEQAFYPVTLDAQEREKNLTAQLLTLATKLDVGENREKALREALEQACDDMAVMIAAVSDLLGNLQAEANLRHYRRVLAGSPSEKPDSALLESAQGLSDPGMADAD